MGRDDDFHNKSGEDLKDGINNFFKKNRKALRDLLRCTNRRKKFGGCNNGFPPFFFSKNPILCLLYPKLIVAGIILITLLLCGVSLYGLLIILLLSIIFILI